MKEGRTEGMERRIEILNNSSTNKIVKVSMNI